MDTKPEGLTPKYTERQIGLITGKIDPKTPEEEDYINIHCSDILPEDEIDVENIIPEPIPNSLNEELFDPTVNNSSEPDSYDIFDRGLLEKAKKEFEKAGRPMKGSLSPED